jgi:hypothetical protein
MFYSELVGSLDENACNSAGVKNNFYSRAEILAGKKLQLNLDRES